MGTITRLLGREQLDTMRVWSCQGREEELSSTNIDKRAGFFISTQRFVA